MEINPLYLTALVVLVGLPLACTSADPGTHAGRDTSGLGDRIRQIAEAAEGTYAVAFIDVADPETNLFIHADEWFHAASTMKTPVMIEVYRQAAEGKFDLDDKLIIRNEFTSIADGETYRMDIGRDSGDALYEHLGSELTIRELVYAMIVRSGNLATNLVIEHVGAENVNRTMAETELEKP